LSLNTGQEITKFKGQDKSKNFTKKELLAALNEHSFISTSIFLFGIRFKTFTISKTKRNFLIKSRYNKRKKIYDKDNI
jgi:hypothetical protein